MYRVNQCLLENEKNFMVTTVHVGYNHSGGHLEETDVFVSIKARELF